MAGGGLGPLFLLGALAETAAGYIAGTLILREASKSLRASEGIIVSCEGSVSLGFNDFLIQECLSEGRRPPKMVQEIMSELLAKADSINYPLENFTLMNGGEAA
ncbi:hypothetical protein BX666DRAFT_1880420 [Dichotomocladium elegans]|nr:hypothetical protein BX666DRAFT_1880420 [Dichotomocladium elegans]